MRLDKLLWCLRVYKTRSIATEACKKGHIKVNNSDAKPSKEVLIGDNLSIKKKQIEYKFSILDMPPSRLSPKLLSLYRQDNTPASALENAKIYTEAQAYYRQKGDGRPTKKDRRDIYDYLDIFLDDLNSPEQEDSSSLPEQD